MLFKKKKFPKLTSREIDILNILWENEKPLIASEIADARSDLTINTVQAVLRKLLKYQLVEVADIVYSGTVFVSFLIVHYHLRRICSSGIDI